MVIESIAAVIGALKSVADLWEKFTQNLPDGPEKVELQKQLAEAQKATALAEVQAARGLGYNLCQCTWPPQIMLSLPPQQPKDPLVFECPKCRRIVIPSGVKFGPALGLDIK